MYQLTCSNKPRPSVHGGRPNGFYKTGECLWGRDVHHIKLNTGRTLCGRDAKDWLTIEEKYPDARTVLKDDNLCRKCAAKL